MDYSFAIVLGVCGVIAAAIGYSKHRSVIVCFLLGALLGVIGIFIAWVLPRALEGSARFSGGEMCELLWSSEHPGGGHHV